MSKSDTPKPPDPKSCFVMMPFSVRASDGDQYPNPNHWDDVYVGLIEPACRQAGLAPIRGDHGNETRLITQSILMKIEAAHIVICDLSSGNANAFLELGWALRANKPYVLIQDDKTKVEFNLNQHASIRYDSKLQPTALQNEVKTLAKTLNDTLKDPKKSFSMVESMGVQVMALEASANGDPQGQVLIELGAIQTKLNDLQTVTYNLERDQGS